jgi:hypothetical protein
MVAVYDPNLRITEQGTGDNPNTWGAILNQQVFTLLSNAISGVTQIDFSAGVNIDISTSSLIPPNDYPGVANGATDTARNMVLELTAVSSPLTTGLTLTLPALQKVYLIRADSTLSTFPITVIAKGGSQSVVFYAGDLAMVYTNGINIYGLDTNGLLEASNNLSDLTSVITARANLGLGSAALLTAGTSANNAVQLDGSGKLPAVDGSQLTNVTGTPSGVGTAAFLNVGTAAGNIPQLNGSAQLPALDGSLLTGIIASNIPTVVLGSTGKCVIPGGLTIQWAPCTTAPGGLTVTFPTAFSAAPYMVWGANALGNILAPPTQYTASNFIGYGGNGSGGSEPGQFIAIGPT